MSNCKTDQIKIKQANVLTLQISPSYFDLVLKRKKTVEGRLAKTRLINLKKGQTIQVHKKDSLSFLLVKIEYIKFYTSFRDMLITEGLGKCLPGIQNLEEGVEIYYGFQDYKQKEKEVGVLAFGIQFLKEIHS